MALRSEDGFTLVELLMVVVLLGVISAIALSGLTASMRTARQSNDRIEALADLQRNIERVAQVVRVADGEDYPVGTPGQLLLADGNDIRLDVRRGTDLIRYRYWRATSASGEPELRLCREVYTPPDDPCATATGQPVLTDLANDGATPLFSYLDAEGAAATGDDIAQVGITLVRDLPTQPAIEVQTTVQLRNAERA
ncbi:MAG: prepilin-type N-terminal cleavage/methylation domain-containing protein [Egibacteraceae bacterium]